MRRLLVAAAAASISVPTLVAAPVAAQAAPTSVTSSTLSTGSTSTTVGSLSAVSLSTLRARAINSANAYSRAAKRVSWRQKDRNAKALSVQVKRAKMPVKQRAVLLSRTQLGTRYRWGGTTAAGFDCSGYTKYIFAKAGKSLPRTAAQQYRATKRTSKPRAGDLVFYGGARAYHVGIYLGNGRMIHSPRSGKSVEVTRVWRGASYGKVR